MSQRTSGVVRTIADIIAVVRWDYCFFYKFVILTIGVKRGLRTRQSIWYSTVKYGGVRLIRWGCFVAGGSGSDSCEALLPHEFSPRRIFQLKTWLPLPGGSDLTINRAREWYNQWPWTQVKSNAELNIRKGTLYKMSFMEEWNNKLDSMLLFSPGKTSEHSL